MSQPPALRAGSSPLLCPWWHQSAPVCHVHHVTPASSSLRTLFATASPPRHRAARTTVTRQPALFNCFLRSLAFPPPPMPSPSVHSSDSTLARGPSLERRLTGLSLAASSVTDVPSAPAPTHAPSSPGASHPITELLVGFDDDLNLVFLLQTATRKYGLIVFLSTSADLGWQEVRAIIDCLELCAPGARLSLNAFAGHARFLHAKYGHAKGPFHPDGNADDDILMIAVYPTRGALDVRDPAALTRAALTFDDANNAFCVAAASARPVRSVIVRVLLAGEDSAVSAKEARVLAAALRLLEPGDVVDDAKLDAFGERARRDGLHIHARDAHSARTLSLSLRPARIAALDEDPPPALRRQNHNPIPPISAAPSASAASIASSIDEVPPSSSASSSVSSSSTVPTSPYAGIQYLRAVKKGGQAQVYKARRRNVSADSPPVAVKVFLGPDSDGVDVYKTELRMLLQMAAHPNVVSVIDFFEVPRPALVMDFIDGQDLSEYLHDHGALSMREGLPLCIGIADGLAHMHKHGIIHRDLKSANILRRSDGVPVIIDLGLSSKLRTRAAPAPPTPSPASNSAHSIASNGDAGLSAGAGGSLEELCSTALTTHVSEQTKTIKGTMLWMAPEMITSHAWSDRTDVYAFGMIMWEIFTGKLPFLSDAFASAMTPMSLLVAIATGTRPSLDDVPHGVEQWVKDLISECWVTDPKKRPKMVNVLHRLQRFNPRAIFDDIDLDHNGTLNFTEFVIFLDKYVPGKIPPESMHPLFKEIDRDGSGKISYGEFKALWRFVSNKFLS